MAVECARTLIDEMPGGVWLVQLAPIRDAAELAPAVLAALGLREYMMLGGALWAAVAEHSADPTDRLAAALAGKRLLLVLDNCEHLVEAVAGLADRLLGESATLRILATSREPLGITGETLWPVEPLALPPAAADATTAPGYASVRLLADRASAVRPGFVIDPANAPAIVHICRDLDGMPLAIELAAARLRAMTPDQVAERLNDRFRLLTAGSRTALPRHQTLRAVVDWSWDLLDDGERALWRRLAIFVAGATVEAVERVCAGGGVPADRVVDLVTSLVDKSLVTVTGETEPRYRMLETIRTYGLDRLADAGEQDAVRRAHAAYFLELAEAAEPHLRGRDQVGWLNRLTGEHDNLHAALRGAIAAGDAQTAVRLVGALGWYWMMRWHRVEGADLAAQALAMPGDVPADQRALAGMVGGLVSFDFGPEAKPVRAVFLSALQAGSGAHPLLRMAGAFIALTDSTRAGAALDELRAHYDDPDPWVAATARLTFSLTALNFGQRHAEVEEDCRAALDRFRLVGDRWGISLALGTIAELAGLRGEHALSAASYEEALAVVAELGTYENLAPFQFRYALQLWLLGEPERAKAMLVESHGHAERLGSPEFRIAVELARGELARLEGDLAGARGWFTRAAELATVGDVGPQLRALLAGAQGHLATASGDLVAAREYHREALANALFSHDSPVIAHVLVGVAELAMREGDAPRAAQLLGAGDSIRGTRDLSHVYFAEVEAAARSALGEAGFTEAYRHGQRSTVDTVEALTDVILGAAAPGLPTARTPR